VTYKISENILLPKLLHPKNILIEKCFTRKLFNTKIEHEKYFIPKYPGNKMMKIITPKLILFDL